MWKSECFSLRPHWSNCHFIFRLVSRLGLVSPMHSFHLAEAYRVTKHDTGCFRKRFCCACLPCFGAISPFVPLMPLTVLDVAGWAVYRLHIVVTTRLRPSALEAFQLANLRLFASPSYSLNLSSSLFLIAPGIFLSLFFALEQCDSATSRIHFYEEMNNWAWHDHVSILTAQLLLPSDPRWRQGRGRAGCCFPTMAVPSKLNCIIFSPFKVVFRLFITMLLTT